MATFTFNADSPEVTGTSGVTKVGSTYQMTGTSAQIDIIADAGGGMAFDHSTALESVSAWEPVPSQVSAWYDADDASTISESGGNVSAWNDKSSEENNLTEATSQPSYVTGQLNGKPVIRFDGTEVISGSFKSGLSSATLFIVVNTNDSTYLLPYNTASGTEYAIAADGTTSTFVSRGFGVPSYYANGQLQSWTRRVDVRNTLNGVPSVVTALGCDMSSWASLSFGLYGLGFDFAGDIAEIIIVPSSLSNADRELYEGYLAWKWGLQASLPSGHTYKNSAPIAPTVDYDITDDAGATNYVNIGNITAVQALANSDHQNEGTRLNLTGVAGAVWNSYTIDNYNADVQPPADPTGAKAVDAEVWAMWWEQSPEGVDIVAHLRRDVSGTTYYLAKVGGLPVWQTSTPTEWWTFSRDNTLADNKRNAWEEDNILSGFEGYYVRFRDLSDNDSAWVLFSEIDPGTKPDPLTNLVIKSIDSGQVTLTGTVPNATDTWFIRYYNASAGGNWSAENPTYSKTDSGDITITGLTDGAKYVFSAYINNGSCDSDWFAPEPFAVPVDSGLPLHKRIQFAVAALISAEGYQTHSGTTFAVSTTWTPRWESQTTPTIFVQPDSFDSEPGTTSTLTRDYGINIAIFEKVEQTDDQMENRMFVYEAIQRLLANNVRPTPESYLAPDSFTDSRAYSADDVSRYSFLTPFAVRYRARCNR